MKSKLLLLPLVFLACVWQAAAQPDCTFTYTAATSGAQSPATSNLFTSSGGSPGCPSWIIEYWTNTSSGTSVQFEGAADAVTGGVHGPTGSYTKLTVSSATGSGANPAIGTTQGNMILCCDYYPWVRVNVNTLTSSGAGTLITVRAYGYRTTSALNGGGGGGGSGLNQLTGDVLAGPGTGSQVATVVGLDSVPFCSGFSPTNGQLIKYTTGGSPNPCYTAATAGGTGSAADYTAVSFSATPTFTAGSNTADAWSITLTGNVSSSTLASAATGERLGFKICQDGTGGRAFVWPTGFTAAATISPFASACTKQEFYWDGSNAVPLGPATVDAGPAYTTEVSAPGSAPPSGFCYYWADSTDHSGFEFECNNSTNIFASVLKGVDITTTTGQVTNLSHVANASLATAGIANNAVTAAKQSVVTTRRTCIIDNDTQSATALVAANFSGRCVIPAAATIVEVDVAGGTGTLNGTAAQPTYTGTGSVEVGIGTVSGGSTTNNIFGTTNALATASGKACALTTTSGTCINGNTSSSSISIGTTALAAGSILFVSAAAADATQTWYNVTIIYTIN